MTRLADRVRAMWTDGGVRVRPGLTAEDIRIFERQHGVFLPPDIVAFLSVVDGFEEGEWDRELIEWYPLSRWVRLTDAFAVSDPLENPSAYFVFADYCLSGALYLVRLGELEEQNTVLGYCAGSPAPVWKIADSFTGLLEAYLRDTAVVLG